LDRILIATTSGQGPDVLNMGNTWTASLQATGALLPWDEKNFDKTGGRDRFVDSALAPTGAEGQDPAAVPLHSMAYALYCNKKMCSPTPASRSRRPPGTSRSPPARSSPGTASGASPVRRQEPSGEPTRQPRRNLSDHRLRRPPRRLP